LPIVWQRPDGSLIVQYILDGYLTAQTAEGESTTDAVTRLATQLQAKVPEWAGLPFTLVPSANMPATNAKRDGWRLVGDRVIEDDAALAAAQDAERARQFDANKLVVALARWTAGKLGVPLAQARSEILAIYRNIA
jgi:hypothetical protein